MPREVERKFLVADEGWRDSVRRRARIIQFYLADGAAASVRVRITDDRDATLAVKSAQARLGRDEFEYAIPLADARAMLDIRDGLVIEKQRHIIPVRGFDWEVDEFGGAHDGLVLAEIELAADRAAPEEPAWLGREVTGDRRYYNRQLAQAAGVPRPD